MYFLCLKFGSKSIQNSMYKLLRIFQILGCDLTKKFPGYFTKIYPCNGAVQFQHLVYQPIVEDDGKQLSCSLDENSDDIPEYTNSAPLSLRVNENLFMLGDISAEDRENLQVEFKDVWGEAHLHSGNCIQSHTII